MRIALFQPDIPQNTGTILRLCACLDVEAHIIEPAGFPVSDRNFRRAGMDYLDQVTIRAHSWSEFEQWRHDEPLPAVAAHDQGERLLSRPELRADDILLFGRESAGVPDEVASRSRRAARHPDGGGMRSLNVAMAAAMALGEALRQTRLAGHARRRGGCVTRSRKSS